MKKEEEEEAVLLKTQGMYPARIEPNFANLKPEPCPTYSSVAAS